MGSDRRRVFYAILAAASVLALSACATVPDTGRSQLLLISPQEESQLGLSEFEKLKGASPISKDAKQSSLVNTVGTRIATVAPLPGAQWEFVVFDDPKTANAFCLPGGKVGIYTGILPITQNEAGLATVMGHEVAHAVARHGAERLSQGLLVELGGQTLDMAMKTQTGLTRQIVRQAYGAGTTLGVVLPYSRTHELEADRLGLIYMARAGYEPREAIEFWKRFGAYSSKQGGRALEFMSTHPLDDTRIRQLESFMPQAMAEYQKARGRF